ncbi:MAG TPA: glycosyltransferase family 4 protein [Burkholderiaceae bacterium]
MKILAVTDNTGYMTGGPATAAVALLSGLAQNGHEIELAIDRPYAGLSGVKHLPFDLSNAADTIRRTIARFRPDVVHLLCMGQRNLQQLSGALNGHRWVLTIHSLSPDERILRWCHYNDSLHYLLRNLRYLPNTLGWHMTLPSVRPPATIVHSRMMHTVASRFLRSGSKIAMIDLAAGTPSEKPSATSPPRRSEGPHLATVGGIAHSKGQHDAILATAMLRDDFPGIHHEFIGEVRDQTYFAHLQSLVDRLGLSQCVQFSPSAKDAVKLATLHTADLYIQPSHEEGFCLAFLEAANIVPRILGTATGAIPEIVGDDPRGRVVPPRRPSALAAAARELLNSAIDPAWLQARQSRLAARFSWASHVAQHETLYRELMCSPAPA